MPILFPPAVFANFVATVSVTSGCDGIATLFEPSAEQRERGDVRLPGNSLAGVDGARRRIGLRLRPMNEKQLCKNYLG